MGPLDDVVFLFLILDFCYLKIYILPLTFLVVLRERVG